jgi:hypothetical protein
MSIAPWSFSKIKAFEQCPKKFYHLKVAKDYSEPETDAMYYGTAFHEAAEEYIRDGVPRCRHSLITLQKRLDSLNSKRGRKLCEYKMGLTENLEPCDFFAKDVWFRGVADLVILDEEDKSAWVVDYKTGRNARYADKGQLELMALATFKHFPAIKFVRGGLMFVVSNELIKDSYALSAQGGLWEKWLGGFSRMESAFENNSWNTNPSGLCRAHCVVLECPHNGRS